MSGPARRTTIDGMQTSRFAFVAAPLLTVAYGLFRLADGLDGTHGPGFLWTAGHLAFLAALFLFVPVLLAARRMAGGGAIATTATAVGVTGVLCAVVQIGIDIVVGIAAEDRAAMQRMFADVQDIPGVALVVYGPGPALFYLGLIALAIRLAVTRAAAVWTPVAMILAVGATLAGLDLLPLAGLLMLAALAPLARRTPALA
jgi:hypothetical protein